MVEHLVDQELALAIRIASVEHLARLRQQAPDCFQQFGRLGDERPSPRDNGELLQCPPFVRWVVHVRRCQLEDVTRTPGDHVVPATEDEAVLALPGPGEGVRDGARQGRLLGEEETHERLAGLHPLLDALAAPASRCGFVLALVYCSARRAVAGDLDRRPGETVTSYAERLLPPGSELASKAVDLKLGSLGKVVVVLFTPAKEEANYTGWVMVPVGTDARAYRKEVLPPLTAASGLFDIEVKSIFAANVEGGDRPDLCILSQYYRNGSAEQAYPATDCFHWSGHKFELIEASGPRSVGLRTAKAVRSYFAKHPIKPGTALPGSKAQ